MKAKPTKPELTKPALTKPAFKPPRPKPATIPPGAKLVTFPTACPSRKPSALCTDGEVLDWMRTQVEQVITHLQTRHPNDARTKALVANVKAVHLLPLGETVPNANGVSLNGKYRYSSGELYVASRDSKGKLRTKSSMNQTILHELGHATKNKLLPNEDHHSPSWKQAWLWLLEVATKELGWQVDVVCAQCTNYGMCSQTQCPKCIWLQRLCKPYVGDGNAPNIREWLAGNPSTPSPFALKKSS